MLAGRLYRMIAPGGTQAGETPETYVMPAAIMILGAAMSWQATAADDVARGEWLRRLHVSRVALANRTLGRPEAFLQPSARQEAVSTLRHSDFRV